MGKNKLARKKNRPLAKLLFESVRWWIQISLCGFINTESLSNKGYAIVLPMCQCVSIPWEQSFLLLSNVNHVSQIHRLFVMKLVKFSAYCTWVRETIAGRKPASCLLFLACCWPVITWMLLSNSAQQSWEPASTLHLENADSEGLWGQMGHTEAKGPHHNDRSWSYYNREKYSIARCSVRNKALWIPLLEELDTL